MSNHRPEPTPMHPTDELAPMIEGELDLAQVREVVRHVRGCPVCQAELVEVAAAIGALHGVARERLDDITEPPPLAVHPLELAAERPPPSRRSRTVRALAAAVAAVVVLVSAGAVVRARLADDPGGQPAVATAELVQEGTVPAHGTVSMTEAGTDQVMAVTTSQLPPAPDGSFYEVWLLQPGTGQMLAVGVLPDGGEASFALPADIVGRYQAVDVSLQPDDGSVVHSGDSILRATYA